MESERKTLWHDLRALVLTISRLEHPLQSLAHVGRCFDFGHGDFEMSTG